MTPVVLSPNLFLIFFSQIPPTAIEIATEEEVSAYVPFHIQDVVLTIILCNSCKAFSGVSLCVYWVHFVNIVSKKSYNLH